MPPKQDRVQIYPTSTSRQQLGAIESGEIGPTLTVAVEAFADLIARATRKNEDRFTRAEWNATADALNGCALVPGAPMPIVWAEVEDGHELMGLGRTWFDAQPDAAIERLVENLRELDAIHTWALIWTIADFWRHCQDVDTGIDEWWTLAHRLKRRQSAEVD